MLSDIPNWTVSFSTLCGSTQAVTNDQDEEIVTFKIKIMSILEDYFTRPMDLKQICRLLIRQTLNANWKLPHGIYSLPLPKSIQKYIDFE